MAIDYKEKYECLVNEISRNLQSAERIYNYAKKQNLSIEMIQYESVLESYLAVLEIIKDVDNWFSNEETEVDTKSEVKRYTAILNNNMSYSVYLGDDVKNNLIETYENRYELLEWIKSLNENDMVEIRVNNF